MPDNLFYSTDLYFNSVKRWLRLKYSSIHKVARDEDDRIYIWELWDKNGSAVEFNDTFIRGM